MAATKEKKSEVLAGLKHPVIRKLAEAVRAGGGEAKDPPKGADYVALKKEGWRLGWAAPRRKYVRLDHLNEELEQALPKSVRVKPGIAHVDENSVVEVAKVLKTLTLTHAHRATPDKTKTTGKKSPAKRRT